MEVISYSIKSSSQPAKATAVKRPFFLKRLTGRNTTYSFGTVGGAKASPKDMKKRVRLLLLLSATVPLYMLFSLLFSRIAASYDERVRKVDFGEFQIEAETELDKAMFDVALSKEAFYDSEGNVVSSMGEAGETGMLFSDYTYKEPVTYTEYTVKAGDSISVISRDAGLSNISTLIAVNGISNVRYLREGQKLKVPSMDGLIHTVAAGETVEGLSVKYRTAVEDILDVNDLDSYTLTVGQELFIPGAKMDSTSLQRAMGELFAWPITAEYRISSRFGARKDPITGADSYHTGIDLACPTGTAVKASMSGTVAKAGWSNVFGNYVIIKHIDGYQTLYGHLSKIKTKKGAFVNQGELIGLVGSTGYSTGPHLHFTVYKNGKLVNPATLLK
ncbi:MAG: M23 family metallopeptidase [Treponema sp.]|nr:M23 family metallopeptidase [Treponema sp.]